MPPSVIAPESIFFAFLLHQTTERPYQTRAQRLSSDHHHIEEREGAPYERASKRMNKVYDSEDCNIFSKALEHAWEMFLRAGRLTPRNLETTQAALTFAIFHAAASGHRNARGLAKIAYSRIDAYEPRIRKERSWGVPQDKLDQRRA